MMGYKSIETLRLYRRYSEQKYRCSKVDKLGYDNYGGRGIKFLFSSFKEWLEELGEKPSNLHSVDRINNDGNYEKGNIRWALPEVQSRNKRNYKTNNTGVKGVNYHKTNKVFISQHNRKILYSGKDFFEACCARKSSELRMP